MIAIGTKGLTLIEGVALLPLVVTGGLIKLGHVRWLQCIVVFTFYLIPRGSYKMRDIC
ncbi:hypothetical protein LINPERPRIM_LOCUS34086 [Linum perenne]